MTPMFIFVAASLALCGAIAWWRWRTRRRRQVTSTGATVPVYWKDERTMYATYEELGIAPPTEAAANGPEATECLDMDMLDALELGSAGEPEATEFLNFSELPLPPREAAPAYEPEHTFEPTEPR